MVVVKKPIKSIKIVCGCGNGNWSSQCKKDQ
jgi:hypothetical protein